MSNNKGSYQATHRREHNLDQEAKRVQLVDPFGGILTDGNFTTRVDEASATVTYLGKAQIGTASDTEEWQIKRITVSGTNTIIEWATGSDDFENAWDSRAGLSYS